MTKKITAWSYSRYSTYEKCPLLAKLKFVDKLKEPENPAMERGKKAHEVLADFMRGHGAERKSLPGWESFGELFVGLRSLEPLVEQQWGFTDGWAKTGWFDSDTWFRAVLDAAVVYVDNTADVVDYKTGKKSPTHAQQAELYAVSIMLRYPPVTNVTVRFWYLDIKDGDREKNEEVFCFGQDDLDGLIQKWTDRVQPMLRDTTFAPRPGNHCKRCHFSKSQAGPCRYG